MQAAPAPSTAAASKQLVADGRPSPNWKALQGQLSHSSRPRRRATPNVNAHPNPNAHANPNPNPNPNGHANPNPNGFRPRPMRPHPSASRRFNQAEADLITTQLLEHLHKDSEHLTPHQRDAPGKYLAIDCEMVGVGPAGSRSVLARVSIVNFYGAIIMDAYVKPKERVTDYRTWVSGIRPEHLANAQEFEEVVSRVAGLIQGKILIGHVISNDLQALLLSHPRPLIRDTSSYQPLRDIACTKSPGLKKLTRILLNVEIQKGAHSSVDDARATMAVYRTQKNSWEAYLKRC